MKITSLEPQKKNKERFNLYIDGTFSCGVEIGSAARLGLYEGKEVSEYEISLLDTEEEYQKCMNSALNLASRRQQSEREYWQKLGKRFEKPTIGRCLDRLRELGYANDELFTEIWVRERSGSRGKRLLESELKQKGIAPGTIEKYLSRVDNETNTVENAVGIALKKYKVDASRETNYSRVMGVLTRRGYSYQIAKEVFDKINKTTD